MDYEGGAVRDLPAPVATEMEDAREKLDAMAAEVPLETPWLAPQAAAWDMETIGSWIADNVKTPYVRDLLAVEVLGSIGPVAPEQSLLWALFAFHAAGGLTTMLTDEGAQAIEGGAQAVALKVAAALGDKVHLNNPVRKITQDARGVEVTADSIVVRARRVIVTVPRTLAGSIRFDPILPADAAQLIQRIPMGSVIKATLVYDEAFWRQDGLSGGSLNVGSPVSSTADGGLASGQDHPGLLIAFIGAESARALGRMSPAERQKIVVGECVKLFGPKAAATFAERRLSPDGTALYRPQLVRRGMDARGLCRLSPAGRPHRIRARDSQAIWTHPLGGHRDGDGMECVHGRGGAIRRTNRRRGAVSQVRWGRNLRPIQQARPDAVRVVKAGNRPARRAFVEITLIDGVILSGASISSVGKQRARPWP